MWLVVNFKVYSSTKNNNKTATNSDIVTFLKQTWFNAWRLVRVQRHLRFPKLGKYIIGLI